LQPDSKMSKLTPEEMAKMSKSATLKPEDMAKWGKSATLRPEDLAKWGKSGTPTTAAAAPTTTTAVAPAAAAPVQAGRSPYGTATLGRDFSKSATLRPEDFAKWDKSGASQTTTMAAAAPASTTPVHPGRSPHGTATLGRDFVNTWTPAKAAAAAAAAAAATTTPSPNEATPTQSETKSGEASQSSILERTPGRGQPGESVAAAGQGAQAVGATNLAAKAISNSLPRGVGRFIGASTTTTGVFGDEKDMAVLKKDEDEDPAELELNEKLRQQEPTLSSEKKEKMARIAEKVREEILSTEKSYLKGLQILRDCYVKKLDSTPDSEIGIEPEDRIALLSNIELIYNFQTTFGEDLLRSGNNIENVFITYSRFFRMYSVYLTGYEACIKAISRLTKSSKKFNEFLNSTVKTELAKHGSLDLMSYLVMPVQRVPRYVLLLRELKKHTLPSNPAFDKIHKALTSLLATATHINEMKRSVENVTKLLSLEQQIRGCENLQLIKPRRYLVRDGQFTIERDGLFGKKYSKRIFFLLSDMIIWTNTSYEFKGSLRLAATKIVAFDGNTEVSISRPDRDADAPEGQEREDSTIGLTRSESYSRSVNSESARDDTSYRFELSGHETTVMVICSSRFERDEWYNAIVDLIAKSKKDRNNDIIRTQLAHKKDRAGPNDLIVGSILDMPTTGSASALRDSISTNSASLDYTQQGLHRGLEDSDEESEPQQHPSPTSKTEPVSATAQIQPSLSGAEATVTTSEPSGPQSDDVTTEGIESQPHTKPRLIARRGRTQVGVTSGAALELANLLNKGANQTK